MTTDKRKRRRFPRIYAVVALAVIGWAVGGRFLHPGDSVVATGPVGGPFALVDHHGNPVTDEDFRGRHMLVYFGYTHCPDICPMSLQTVTEALDLLPPAVLDRITPLVISVDPARDTPQRMAEYVGYFHPRLIGLTGDAAAVRRVARAYRVFAERDGDGPDYEVTHTSLLFLMDRNGDHLARLGSDLPPDALAERLRTLILARDGG